MNGTTNNNLDHENGSKALLPFSEPQQEKTEQKKDKSFVQNYGILLFTINMCIINFRRAHAHVYYAGTVRMLEKQYGFKTTETGFLQSVDNFCAMALVLVGGYLGDKIHKARLIAFISVLSGFSVLLSSFPYFFTKGINDEVMSIGPRSFNSSLNETMKKQPDVLCSYNSSSESQDCIIQQIRNDAYSNRKAFSIFVFSRFLLGIGGFGNTLAMTYVTENSRPSVSSLCIGVMLSMVAVGPVFAFMVAGIFNKIPLHLKDVPLTPKDPRFIGAWWLGYLVNGGLYLLFAIPLFFFPTSLIATNSQQEHKDVKVKERKPCIEHIRDVYRALATIFRQPAYIIYQIALGLIKIAIVSYIFNLARYMEIHFRIPIFKAVFYTGAGSATAGVIGTLSSSAVLSRLKLSTVRTTQLMAASMLLCTILLGIMMTLRCPQLEYAEQRFSTKENRLLVSTSCSDACGCDVSSSQPVCGSDGKNYFTPCHAGCKSKISRTQNFTECTCVPGGTSVSGTCPMECPYLIPYDILLFIFVLSHAFMRVPKYIVMLRVLPKDVRSFGLGIHSFITNALGYLPGPIVFGRLIDGTCLIWQKKCNKTGSCLMYDVDLYRNITHGAGTVALALATLSFMLGWWVIRNKKFEEDQRVRNEEEINAELEPFTENKSIKRNDETVI